MVRPFTGLQKLIELMAAELTRQESGRQSGAQQRP
jgi:hypothetical protein